MRHQSTRSTSRTRGRAGGACGADRGWPTGAAPRPPPGARVVHVQGGQRLAGASPVADLLVQDDAHRGIDAAVHGLPARAEHHRRVADGAAGDARHAALAPPRGPPPSLARAAAAPCRRRRAGSPPCSSITSLELPQPGAGGERLAHPRARARPSGSPAGQVQHPGRQLDARAPRGPAGPRPFRVSMHSATSRALPTARPSGWSMSVMRAATFLPMPAADVDHGLGQRPRVLERLHEGAVARLHVEDEGVDALRHLLAHDGGGDEGPALHGGGHVAQRVELAVGGGDLRGLADEAHAGCGAARRGTRRGRGPRGSRGSTPACRACRRCGRGRGPRSSARRRRRPRPAAPAPGSSCRPRRPSSACPPWGRAGRRGRAPRRCASSASVRATVSAGGHAPEEDGHGQGRGLVVGHRAARCSRRRRTRSPPRVRSPPSRFFWMMSTARSAALLLLQALDLGPEVAALLAPGRAAARGGRGAAACSPAPGP